MISVIAQAFALLAALYGLFGIVFVSVGLAMSIRGDGTPEMRTGLACAALAILHVAVAALLALFI